jgi:hypothetical protein
MSKIEFLKNFWGKKIIKNCKKNETIKKISVRPLKKNFKKPDDIFFFKNIL